MSKSRFNEIEDMITKANERKKVEEDLLEGIISGKINKVKAKKMFNNIAEDASKLSKLEVTESREKMLPDIKQLEEDFRGTKTNDEVDDETNNKTDDKYNEDGEQPDTTDMPDLESEGSAEQRKEKREKD